ncbi:C4-dicarboxylate transporter DcuC [Anaerosinus massiliensis]|uniref:C4-dicarboxylate transporter DcuC n=1 Tax=Massilibacillus massiliensis TaxID=1806837 RepID=UPI000B0B925D|nr:C4-dicarboxylate transporter DcuC [Massilibacillus massiliensis]
MLGIIIGLIVTVVVGYLVVKKKKAQTVLVIGGLFLMAVAAMMGHPLLDAKKTTGFIIFDMFKYIENIMSTRTAALGLLIMAVGGYARYMDAIGASKVLVRLAIHPLSYFKSPYLVLALSYVLGQILHFFLPSAAGLSVLLMATMFPVLISLGVSRLSAAAVIGTTACLDLGPASGNSVLAAKNAGLEVATYFTNYQIPVAIPAILTVAILHFFVQKYFDKREGHLIKPLTVTANKAEDSEEIPPMIYACLPIIPLILILVFSDLCIPSIKMTVVTAMLISMAVSMVFEFVRTRDMQKVFGSIQVFFDGMGKQFATVVTLIVAGETFAYGLTKIGAIEGLIHLAQDAGFGIVGMTIVMSLIIMLSAIVMGSANAPFFAFAALAPIVAAKMQVMPVLMLLPMQLTAGIARSVSPITAAIVAVAGIAEVSSVDIVKRTAIPMAGAFIVMMISTFCLL